MDIDTTNKAAAIDELKTQTYAILDQTTQLPIKGLGDIELGAVTHLPPYLGPVLTVWYA